MDFDHNYADYLDEKGIAAIKALEKETGHTIMAYPNPPLPADLPKDQVSKIRELEKKLCVRLVAYETH